MKLRKTLALIVAFAMIASMVPAFGLTAFAAVGEPIITEDGKIALIQKSDNLIADGGFETDAWQDALTVGKFDRNSSTNGVPGVGGVSPMNRDGSTSGVNGGVFFERVAPGRDGSGNALNVAFSTSTSGRTFNKGDGPAAIKKYIQNTSSDTKTYYVSFYAKSASATPAIYKYYIGNITATGTTQDISIAASADTAWKKVEAVAEVAKNDYLIINIFGVDANTVYFDDFTVYEAESTADAKEFAKAMTEWDKVFTYKNNQIISGNMTLPTASAGATVVWKSSNPQVIAADGKFAAPLSDTTVTLTATISVGAFSIDKAYTFKVNGIKEDIEKAVKASVPSIAMGDLKLPSTLKEFEGSKVEWASSDESIISKDGKYTKPDKKGEVTLTATVTYDGNVVKVAVKVLVGNTSLIPNGSFDVVTDDGIIEGWTVGTGEPMKAGVNFDYVTDPTTGNKYIVSKTHGAENDAGSIKTYIDLEPGKVYSLSFKLWYQGGKTSVESYTGAFLVSSNSSVSPSDLEVYGGYDYPKGSFNVTKDMGWQTVTVPVLKPDAKVHTLLISAMWLNKNDGGAEDGRWAFDDFILEEVDTSVTGTVTVNYLSADDKTTQLKESRISGTQYAGQVYYATAKDKATFEISGDDYVYDETSVDHVMVEEGDNNVINLYFKKRVPTNVTVKFVDRATGLELKDAELAIGYVGFVYEATNAQKATIKGSDGAYYMLDPSSEISVIAQEVGTELVLYFEKSNNLIENGDFSNGDMSGWTNRLGTAVANAKVEYEDGRGNVASIDGASGTGGKAADDSIGTAWTVTKGKKYLLSFDIFGTTLTENNYQYNKISNAYTMIDNGVSRSVDGKVLLEFGKEMTLGQWNHMEIDFEAETDMVYFQSSYLEGIKLANFMLKEFDESKVGSVVIEYLDRDGDKELKASKPVEGLVAGMTYTASDEDKEDIVLDGVTYTYDTESVDSVTIAENITKSIKLYFKRIDIEGAEPVTVDVAEGEEVVLPDTVNVKYTDGSVKPAKVTWEVVPSGLVGGDVKEVKGTVAGVEAVATINVFYGAGLPEDYDKYQWVGGGDTKYPAALDAQNMIPNGDFENGNTDGWTATANGTSTALDPTVWTVGTTNVHSGSYALTNLGESQGGDNAKNLQTYFPVENGKIYLLTYWEYINKDEASCNDRTMDAQAIVSTNHIQKANVLTACGGYSSWVEEGNGARTRAKKAGWTMREFVLDTRNVTNAAYAVIAYSWTKDNTFALDDFSLYEITSDEGYKAGGMQSKVTVIVDGVATETFVEKGSALPNYASQYPGALISIEGDTNQPNVTVTVTNGAPAFKSSIAVVNGKAVVYAVDEALAGTLVIAQYNAEKSMIDVATTPVNVAAGAKSETAIVPVSDAAAVRVMLVESLETMKPIVKSTSASAGSYAPAVLTVSDEPQASSGHVAWAMFDGDKVNTRWTSKGPSDEDHHCWVIMDFGQEVSPETVELYYDKYAERNSIFKLSVSTDGMTYDTVFDGKTDGNQAMVVSVSDRTFRYIKLECNGNDAPDPKWTSINEIVIK